MEPKYYGIFILWSIRYPTSRGLEDFTVIRVLSMERCQQCIHPESSPRLSKSEELT